MGTSWVAVSINNIKTRASREMTSRKNINIFDFNGVNVAKHWHVAGEVFAISDCLVACLQGCHSIHQMANLTNVAKMEFDPTPTYRPITPRYLIRFSSFKIWWHDNMLTYAHTKYWIHPITRTYLAGFRNLLKMLTNLDYALEFTITKYSRYEWIFSMFEPH